MAKAYLYNDIGGGVLEGRLDDLPSAAGFDYNYNNTGASNVTLTTSDIAFQAIKSTANVTVTLPTGLGVSDKQYFSIHNDNNTGLKLGYLLTIDLGGGILDTINPKQTKVYLWTGTRWETGDNTASAGDPQSLLDLGRKNVYAGTGAGSSSGYAIFAGDNNTMADGYGYIFGSNNQVGKNSAIVGSNNDIRQRIANFTYANSINYGFDGQTTFGVTENGYQKGFMHWYGFFEDGTDQEIFFDGANGSYPQLQLQLNDNYIVDLLISIIDPNAPNKANEKALIETWYFTGNEGSSTLSTHVLSSIAGYSVTFLYDNVNHVFKPLANVPAGRQGFFSITGVYQRMSF